MFGNVKRDDLLVQRDLMIEYQKKKNLFVILFLMVFVDVNFIIEQEKMKVKFKKFSSLARVSKKATPGSACYDVYSARDVQLGPGVTKLLT